MRLAGLSEALGALAAPKLRHPFLPHSRFARCFLRLLSHAPSAPGAAASPRRCLTHFPSLKAGQGRMMCARSLACGPQGSLNNRHSARLFRVPSARYLVTGPEGPMAPLKRDGLARALELARRSAGCRGAPHAVDADIDALVEFGRIIFRVALGDTRALCVRVFRRLSARV